MDQLSKPIRHQLAGMEVGDTSQAVEIPLGWMIFKLVGERPGQIPPQGAVEMEIRKAVYQRKFNAYLDEHIELLRDKSEIRIFDERIEAHFPSGVSTKLD